MSLQSALKQHGFCFQDLQSPAGLLRLDDYFQQQLSAHDPALLKQLLCYRQRQPGLTDKTIETNVLLASAQYLASFLGELFGIGEQLSQHRQALVATSTIFEFKTKFVKRFVKKALHSGNSSDFSLLDVKLQARLKEWESAQQLTLAKDVSLEARVASWGVTLAEAKAQHRLQDQLLLDYELLLAWCAAAITTEAGRRQTQGWISLELPQLQDFFKLVPYVEATSADQQQLVFSAQKQRPRAGFDLEPTYLSALEIQDEAHYCILCHKNDGDFCRKGFAQKKTQPELGFRQNPLQQVLTGCPVEVPISQMHLLQQQGDTLAALAMIMVEHPLCAATGHRICNDCMLACIYQKQQPVDIPQTETGILRQILDMPWGVELYLLLIVWNPLRAEQWCYQSNNNRQVIVVGQGPAGFTMAHHLTMAGCEVVAADGLMIEPIDPVLLKEPIFNFAALNVPQSQRIVQAFGGVAEYGITNRWDKNFLNIIYISLMRRAHFKLFDAVRFGGQLTVDKAWQLGCDHLVVAAGAGLPRELPIPGALAPGMWQASDFLMNLQLNAAYQFERLVHLEVRLPAIVIGGGLTAVDSATELQAYYIVQVEQIKQRFDLLEQHWGKTTWQTMLAHTYTDDQLQCLNDMLAHASLIVDERQLASEQKRAPNFIDLVQSWGGVSIVYRQGMQDSPAYRTNHQELSAALAQGIIYREGLQPIEARIDKHGRCRGLLCQQRIRDENGQWQATDSVFELGAHCILVATGAKPNIAYEYEHRGTFIRDQISYQSYRQDRSAVVDAGTATSPALSHCKQQDFGAFTSYNKEDRRVSFIGDTHPLFHGSVVKAIASAKRSYPVVLEHLQTLPVKHPDQATTKLSSLADLFNAQLLAITRLNERTLQLTIRAPLAAQQFAPGVFYRLQSYVSDAAKIADTLCQPEPLALLGLPVASDPDCLRFIVSEHSMSARMVASWQVGQRLALMGPSGVNNHKLTTKPGDLLVMGQDIAAMFLLSIGQACQSGAKKIHAVLQFNKPEQVFCIETLHAYTDSIIWCITDNNAENQTQAEHLLQLRVQDRIIFADIKQVLSHIDQYPHVIDQTIGQVITIADSRVLCAVNKLRMLDKWRSDCEFTGSVYGPMQCMLKGICASCLQWQIDPKSKQRTKAVYACSWHHQPLELIDLDHLAQRQQKSVVLGALHELWFDYILLKRPPDNWT